MEEVASGERGKRKKDRQRQDLRGQRGKYLVIKAGEIHSFKAGSGINPLLQGLDVHLSPRFIQENL